MWCGQGDDDKQTDQEKRANQNREGQLCGP
jgi:hypothetical protein